MPVILCFFTMFALLFPAMTGVMAGANMSGDLAERHRTRSVGRSIGNERRLVARLDERQLLLLAHLLTRTSEWRQHTIRLLRIVDNDAADDEKGEWVSDGPD